MRKMIITLVAISSINSYALVSDKPNACEAVDKRCDVALAKKNEVIKAQDKIIADAGNTISKLSVANDEKDEKLKKPYRNPLLMAGSGAALGLAIGNPIVIVVGFLAGLIF